ncbi:mechanosensitive ion channel domain-containing protein [Aquimarina agarivorans]|uniref:mechanosensitive ion channel domain-containing protein n=1 Tax=Aquimarina agarivorans TaxID=980584 RepID=UPI000248FCFC|nr:mechanosensitive ion channel domain-containing protein [Aquimarina agarivorans]
MHLTDFKSELLYSILILIFIIIAQVLTKRAVKQFSFVKAIDANRRKIVLTLSYFIFYFFAATLLSLIWGIEFKQLAVFISSILAILGVGFFAQWSILSNLTASVILFFHHPVRIGDDIHIIDKDYNWKGKVKDITGFYFFIQLENGDDISLPNSLVIQKGIQIIENKKANTSNSELYEEKAL